MAQRVVIPGFRKIEVRGTGNYNDLTNKPSINNVPLVGNLNTVNLKLTDATLTEEGVPAEAKTVGTKLEEQSSNLTSEIRRAKETEETLKSRVDTITSLPEGSTTGDAELQDIRVKADGTIAENAGNAVRDQFNELKSDLVKLEDDLGTTQLLTIDYSVGRMNTNGSMSTSQYSHHKVTECTAGEVYFVSGTGLSSDTSIWVFTDSSGNVVKYRPLADETLVDERVVVPSGATKLYVNSPSDKDCFIKKYVVNVNSYEKINDYRNNLFNRFANVFGNASYSGLVITHNATNGGVISNRLGKNVLFGKKITLRIKGTTTLSKLNVYVVITNSNSSDEFILIKSITVPSIDEEITFNAENMIANKDAQSFRILFNSGDGSGVTTFESIELFNSNELQETDIYNSNFEIMMCNISNAIISNAIIRTFEVGLDKKYTSLLSAIIDAMEHMDSVVRVDSGTYDLVEEYKTIYGASYFDDFSYSQSGMGGLYLKNRVHIIFEANNKVILNYDGTNTDVQTYFSAFNGGEYGFTIENMNLETKNIRYAIHDERNGDIKPNANKYINCSIKHDSSETAWGAHQCIGGGFGKSTFIEIRGCKFNAVGMDYAVSYHNVNIGGSDYQSKIEMHDCYFENGGFYIGNFGNCQKVSEAYVSNCSFPNGAKVIRYYNPDNGVDNTKLIDWNNEFRSN